MRPVAAPVLLLADDPADVGAIRRSLELTRQFVVHPTRNPQEALQVLAQTSFALLILDSGSVDLIQRFLKTMKPTPQDIPVIVLSSRLNEELARAALLNGASDFVPKTADSVRALPRIAARSIERHSLVREVRELRARLGTNAEVPPPMVSKAQDRPHIDGLTGLPTRQGLFQTMTALANRKEPVSVLMIDVLDLRQINEQFGDDEGDKVLREIARMIKTRLGPRDAAGRYDGDAFVVVILADDERLRAMLQDIREEIHSLVREKVFMSGVELRVAQRTSAIPSPVVLQDAEFGLV